MSLADYARHRGVEPAVVTSAMARGAVKVYLDEAGQRYVLAEESDTLWKQRTANPNAGRPRKKVGDAPVSKPHISNQDDDDDESNPKLYKSKAKKEHFLALQAELKFQTDMKLLIKAADVEKEWTSILSNMRTKILGIPSKYRQRFPEMLHDQYLQLEEIVREALTELADANISENVDNG